MGKRLRKGNNQRYRVYEVAAEVLHEKGYDNTSMSDLAAAVGLTKAGLYHHITSKERLLHTILDYGLDLTESYVVEPLRTISDPLERLKTMIERHLKLILEERNREVTGLLHECKTLSRADQARINRRKKKYVRMTTQLIRDVMRKYKGARVDPKLAAFALLGMLNWTYQWYKPAGSFTCKDLVKGFQRLFVNGILERPPTRAA